MFRALNKRSALEMKLSDRVIAGARLSRRRGASLFLTLLLSLTCAVPALAAPSGFGPAWEIEHQGEADMETLQPSQPTSQIPYNGDVNTLKTAAETDKLIVVVGNPGYPANATLTYYEKDQEGRLQQSFSVEAVNGMNGISADKTEGDMKTPGGVYSFTMAFGMKDNPGSILPYRKVINGDHFVDDSNSKYYNRLVNEFEVAKDWSSSENLIRQAPHYNYALVLNYNPEYTPGKGSAIFLHCPKTSNNTGTSGCISIPEERMRELVTKADQNTKIIVVPEAGALAGY